MLPKCFISCKFNTSCKLDILLVNENIQLKNRERERESVRWRYLLKEKDVRFRDAAKMMWCLTVERNEKSSWWQLNGILDIHVITCFTKMCIFLDSKFNNNWITRNLPFYPFQCTINFTLVIYCNLVHATYHFPIKVVAVFVFRVFERTKPRVKCAVPFASLQQKIYKLFSRNSLFGIDN